MKWLRAIATVVAVLALAPSAWSYSLPPGDVLDFEIWRDGKRIGRHTLNFKPDGKRLHVDIRISIDVKILFVTVYSYRHRNQETWRDGRLVAIETETVDGGDDYRLRGALNGAVFRSEGTGVEKAGGKLEFSPDILPTSYWNIETLQRTVLLNTQDGRRMTVSLVPGDEGRVATTNGEIAARHFVMSGGLDLELWYDEADLLAKIRFTARSDGSVIEYRRIGG